MATRKKMEDNTEESEALDIKFKKELFEIEIPKLNKESDAMTELLKNPIFD
jgi:hypothetical protein